MNFKKPIVNQVVFLVGGYGKRLGKITKNIPKPMVRINNKPFIEYLMIKLANYNYKNILFISGYKGNLFKKKFKKKYKIMNKTFNIDHYQEKKLSGTAAAIKKVEKKLEDYFLLLNGDTYFDINLDKFDSFKKSKSLLKLSVLKKKSSKSGNIYFDKKKNIYTFIEKPKKNLSSYINGGVYLVNKKLIKFIKKETPSFERDIIPKIFEKKLVEITKFSNKFIDIGTPNNLKKAKSFLSKI